MSFKGLAHLGIYTSDINVSKQFYIENFGFKFMNEVTISKPNGSLKLAFIDLNGFVIELLENKDKVGQSGSIEHFAIRVENIDSIVKDLKMKGLQFETEEPMVNETLKAKMIFLSGPSRERIELFEYLR